MKVNEPILDRMKLYLDFAVRKQKVIASNLANVETPGYQRKELEFEEIFQSEVEGQLPLQRTSSQHLGSRPALLREPVVKQTYTGSMGYDGNNVDLDQEMTDLSQNVLKFSVVSQLLQKKLSMIAYSIREGRS
ncbi:MAG TPA: flagellar basal body rod protein FlgB [Acidobacteriota bacterium]|nr:flagellar basal body rod protein FlgB [Acidobacteriota bacterium]